jgi:hypothetical protein
VREPHRPRPTRRTTDSPHLHPMRHHGRQVADHGAGAWQATGHVGPMLLNLERLRLGIPTVETCACSS